MRRRCVAAKQKKRSLLGHALGNCSRDWVSVGDMQLGWKTQPTRAVMFDNCRVPVSNRLGKEGDGFKIAMMGLDGGRLSIGESRLGLECVLWCVGNGGR